MPIQHKDDSSHLFTSQAKHPGTLPDQSQYNDPLDRFWNLYLVDADKTDKTLTDGWKGDTDGILIFTGLFSTTVGAFLIFSFPSLSPDSNAEAAALLRHIAFQLAHVSQQIAPPQTTPALLGASNLPSLDNFAPPSSAIIVNALWTVSLVLSISCALAATLVQQWSRRYLADVLRRGPPRKRGPVHAFLRTGIERFRMNGAVGLIITLLHIAVAFFIAGLLEYTYHLHPTVWRALLAVVTLVGSTYIALSWLPISYPDCPYGTPLTSPLQAAKSILFRAGEVATEYALERYARSFSSWSKWNKWWLFFNIRSRGRNAVLACCHREVATQRPDYVLRQMGASLDETDEIYELFFTISAYLYSLYHSGFDEHQLQSPELFMSAGMPDLFDRLSSSYGSYHSSMNPGSLMTHRRINQLKFLIFFTNRAITAGDARVPVFDKFAPGYMERYLTVMSTHDIRDRGESYRAPWHTLLRDSNPQVSLLAFCHLSSRTLLYRATGPIYRWSDNNNEMFSSVSDMANVRNAAARYTVLSSVLGGDALVVAAADVPLCEDLYRLLFFIRSILYFGALPDSPLSAHTDVWLQVLEGLCNQAFRSDLSVTPPAARIYLYKVLSSVSRDDLLPHGVFGLPRDEKRRDYSVVFEEYPILGGTLRALVSAICPASTGATHEIVSEKLRRISMPILLPSVARIVLQHWGRASFETA